jgi:hypothetical protein
VGHRRLRGVFPYRSIWRSHAPANDGARKTTTTPECGVRSDAYEPVSDWRTRIRGATNLTAALLTSPTRATTATQSACSTVNQMLSGTPRGTARPTAHALTASVARG